MSGIGGSKWTSLALTRNDVNDPMQKSSGRFCCGAANAKNDKKDPRIRIGSDANGRSESRAAVACESRCTRRQFHFTQDFTNQCSGAALNAIEIIKTDRSDVEPTIFDSIDFVFVQNSFFDA